MTLLVRFVVSYVSLVQEIIESAQRILRIRNAATGPPPKPVAILRAQMKLGLEDSLQSLDDPKTAVGNALKALEQLRRDYHEQQAALVALMTEVEAKKAEHDSISATGQAAKTMLGLHQAALRTSLGLDE